MTNRRPRAGFARNGPKIPCVVLLLLVGCQNQTWTIEQLGHPEFEEVVGPATRYELQDPEQIQGLDAFTKDVRQNANHSFVVSFWPLGNEEKIWVQVRARPKGQLGLTGISAAVFAVSRQQAQTFAFRGQLPSPENPIAFATQNQVDDKGNLILDLILPRTAIPQGTEQLAIPVLVQFADDWIHIRFYQTGIPAPIPTMTPEEAAERAGVPSAVEPDVSTPDAPKEDDGIPD